MHLSTKTLASILTILSTATAGPLTPRQATDLQPFIVNTVNVGTPSGRVGSSPWATITASITDPNVINLGNSTGDGSPVTIPAGSQGLNCQATYYTRGSDSPIDRTYPCDAVSNGFWTMRVLAPASGAYKPSDFRLRFTHVAETVYKAEPFSALFEAEGAFRVSQELSGQCGGSGVCGWQLRAPVELAVTRV